MRRRLSLLVLLLGACRTSGPSPTPDATAAGRASKSVASKPALPLPPGFDASVLDERVLPCDDFYQYACGGWLARTAIPPERAEWSRSFAEIDERNLQVLKDLLEMLASGKEPPGTAYGKKLGDFYASCMDEPKLEQALPELKESLKKLRTVRDAKTLGEQVAGLHAEGVDALFRLYAAQDFEDAQQVIAFLDQGGLTLPDRDYYLQDDEKTKAIRARLLGHIQEVFQLLGDDAPTASARAGRILALETELARASMDRVARRDPRNLHHPMTLTEVKALAPHFPWDRYLKRLGLSDVQRLNVPHPPFLRGLEARLVSTPARTWQDYLVWQDVRRMAQALPRKFQEADFAFQSQSFTGSREDLPRWKKCVDAADTQMGEALARPFVARTFGEDAKPRAEELIAQIEAAMHAGLESITWMDAPTRAQALLKLAQLDKKIGYPETWRSYDKLEVSRASYLTNLRHARAFERAFQLHKIGRPLDRKLWDITPPTVNAYYEPPRNEIVFPAGILQPPFFATAASPALNYGAIGMVMGHEVTHGFDDEGRQYDGKGNLRPWWTPASDKAFRERADCVKQRFDQEVVLGQHLNGALTLGENVADLGGVKLALAAFHQHLAAHPETARYRYTPDQQFFLGYAQSWCEKRRDERMRMLIQVDPHAPAAQRVNVPLSNLPEFRAAFQCQAGQKMVSAQPCSVW